MKLKSKRTLGWYFKRAVVLVLILIFIYLSIVSSGTWSMNKTVGWAWDISNIIWWIAQVLALGVLVLVVFVLAYLVKKVFHYLKNKHS